MKLFEENVSLVKLLAVSEKASETTGLPFSVAFFISSVCVMFM